MRQASLKKRSLATLYAGAAQSKKQAGMARNHQFLGRTIADGIKWLPMILRLLLLIVLRLPTDSLCRVSTT